MAEPWWSDIRAMQEIIAVSDMPPVVLVERRHIPDRRAVWRGGRRNSDWAKRPIGAWKHFEQQFSPWRLWLAKLPLADRAPLQRARTAMAAISSRLASWA
jgi:hypothetical protein